MSITCRQKAHGAVSELDFSRTGDRLQQHRFKYNGKLVVLDCDRLTGARDDPQPIVIASRQLGVKMAFVEFKHDGSGPFLAGWT